MSLLLHQFEVSERVAQNLWGRAAPSGTDSDWARSRRSGLSAASGTRSTSAPTRSPIRRSRVPSSSSLSGRLIENSKSMSEPDRSSSGGDCHRRWVDRLGRPGGRPRTASTLRARCGIGARVFGAVPKGAARARSHRRSSLLDLTEGLRQRAAAGHAELAVHATQVGLDRPWGQHKKFGDFPRRTALCDGFGDVRLLGGECGPS